MENKSKRRVPPVFQNAVVKNDFYKGSTLMYLVSRSIFGFKKTVFASVMLLCLLMIGARAQDNGTADFNKGLEDYNHHRYVRAMPLLQKAAAGGNTDAMDRIGMIYYYGHAVAVDYGQAMRWFQKAADLDNADSMNNIGVLYANGWGVQLDLDEAFFWWKKAAVLGNQDAIYALRRSGR